MAQADTARPETALAHFVGAVALGPVVAWMCLSEAVYFRLFWLAFVAVVGAYAGGLITRQLGLPANPWEPRITDLLPLIITIFIAIYFGSRWTRRPPKVAPQRKTLASMPVLYFVLVLFALVLVRAILRQVGGRYWWQEILGAF